MSKTIEADASPEKRLFISLLTRDISLVAALLDLIDNSINAVLEPHAHQLRTAQEYIDVFADEGVKPEASISITFDENKVEIVDTAGGISAATAQGGIFKFGRSASDTSGGNDRLSVYGIGLKRAMFKLGNKIAMRSDHVDGGFDLRLNVSEWAADTSQPWTFKITPRAPVSQGKGGTTIVVTDLYNDVKRRLSDGVFEGQLRESVAKTYAYFMAKFVTIAVNARPVESTSLEIGSNHSSESYELGAVSCAITVGLGIPQGGQYRDKSSGWFVFCNGRAVVSADKTPLTGWGAGLPIFQPKHRPFLGNVFFVSEEPEALPWTTTKSAIDEDSATWQTAKRHMTAAGRLVVNFLDGRYTDEGTEISSKELEEVTKARVSLLSTTVAQKQTFVAPTRPKAASTTRIQYDARIDDVKKVAEHLRRPSMSGSDVGRHTFLHFLRNEVGEK